MPRRRYPVGILWRNEQCVLSRRERQRRLGKPDNIWVLFGSLSWSKTQDCPNREHPLGSSRPLFGPPAEGVVSPSIWEHCSKSCLENPAHPIPETSQTNISDLGHSSWHVLITTMFFLLNENLPFELLLFFLPLRPTQIWLVNSFIHQMFTAYPSKAQPTCWAQSALTTQWVTVGIRWLWWISTKSRVLENT
jgi:hypothetical protein